MLCPMNKLPTSKRAQILSMLCEGMSMRSVERLANVSLNTVSKLLVEAGEACAKFHDANVRGVRPKFVQADEIWSFTYAKERTVPGAIAAPEGAGDTWTWTAMDSDSKLLISYLVGKRDSEYALAFMSDLASRTEGRFQLTTDGHKAYVEAIEDSFGADIDFAQIVKQYKTPAEGCPERRYSPAVCTGVHKHKIEGSPNMAKASTSHVERANLSMRMHMRRYTRLTNAFSKKFENHCHMVAIYTVFYNFCRVHKSLRVTPAQQAGLTDRIWEMTDIVAYMDSIAPAPTKRGPYKKRKISN